MTENSPVLKDNFSTELQSSLEDKKVIILNLKVVRRDGSITPFKSEKISNAIKKAFLAQTKIRNNKSEDNEQKENMHQTVAGLTEKVVTALEQFTTLNQALKAWPALAKLCPPEKIKLSA